MQISYVAYDQAYRCSFQHIDPHVPNHSNPLYPLHIFMRILLTSALAEGIRESVLV